MALEPPVTALLMDLDGTLLGNRGVPLSVEFIKRALGRLHVLRGWRKAATLLLALKNELTRPSQQVALTNNVRLVRLFAKQMKLTEAEAALVMNETLSLIFPDMKKYFFQLPGGKKFVKWAADRYKLVLATNPVWPRELIDLRVRWAGLDPKVFSFITDVNQMRAFKPDPRYFEEILAHEKLMAEECMFVGNEFKMDLPATRVGIRTFIVESRGELKALPPRKNRASAWRGGFTHLKKLLLKGTGA